jgi:mannosyl-oligosaccharide alpha-1,2-mannosidase
MPSVKRFSVLLVLTAITLITLYRFKSPSTHPITRIPPLKDGRFHWETRPQLHPVSSMIPLPTGKKAAIPKIQSIFPTESVEARMLREERLKAIKETFIHTWKGYKECAWLTDELAPISGGNKSTFGGWAATLVDSLDTLWLMDLREDFEAAVAAVRDIDFTSADAESINIFETTIRYLGGFLAAYDVSGGRYPVLLEKAREVGEMLYAAFDTPNRMPVARWDWKG